MGNNITRYDQIARVALDLSKSRVQAYAEDAKRKQVMNRKMKSDRAMSSVCSLPPCEVAMEACSTAHHGGGSWNDTASAYR